MTITLNLPGKMAARAQELANERDIEVDTLMLEALADYLEEQEDIAEAKAALAQVRSGQIKAIPWEQVRAELMAEMETSPETGDEEA